MDRFEQYRVFAHVAELGSFIKTATLLQMPRASVSAAVQQLESQLGTRLLHRTTRKVSLTTDGEQLLDRIYLLLAEVEDIDHLFQRQQQHIAGRLTIDAPSRIARRMIAPALPELLSKHPDLQISLSSSDLAVNLVQEGVDCAIRIGTLYDGSLVVQKLGHIALINCTSPEYLRQHGKPHHPDDLTNNHWAVGYAAARNGREAPWEYHSPLGSKQLFQLPTKVTVSNAESYIACCLAGLGLIQVPRFDVQHLLDSGELIEIMPDYCAADMPVALVYPHRRQSSRRLKVFQEWFAALIKPYLVTTDS
ncbi:MAG: LysR family transcriptional regulator [Moraxellaceae bacterium]|nr:LysR family transcriptional regulator [Moraxellaceae bacterium]MDZ4386283.1 LysR family transcriptional regulator [Moraxellaceae bacterium]